MSLGAAAAMLAGNAIMDALGIGKAYLKVFEPQIVHEEGKEPLVKPKGGKIDEFEFDYNPKELKFSRKANVKETPSPGGQSAPDTQLLGPDPEEHTFELFYSRFEVPDLGGGGMFNDLEKIKERLLKLVQADKSTLDGGKVKLRPIVQFGWGPFVSKNSFVENVDITFEMFLPNGEPMRMKATIKIKEAPSGKQKTNPSSGGTSARRSHTLLAGETLAAVAFKEYSNAAMWRAIALENGIDDPLRLQAGTELLLPPLDEAIALS